jgi:hypothetical protein
MQDFQEHTTESCPLFSKENYHEEISHPRPAKSTKQQIEEKNSPTIHVYDDFESNPWESQEEKPEEQQKGQFISCPEPVNEQPSPGTSQPASTCHPLVPTRDVQPCVSSCVAEQVACYKFFGVCRLATSL